MKNWLTERNTILVRLFVAILFTAAPAESGGAGINDRGVAIVYVTNWGSNSVSRFELSAGGSLALREVIPAPEESANALGAASSSGRRSLYVAQWGSGSLSQFQIKRDGRLAALVTVPAAAPAPTDSAQVVISPDSRRAYMTNFNDGAAGTLSIYDLSRTPRAIATIPTGGEGTAGAAISADGQILYVAHMTSGDVTAFRIGNDRTPTRLGSWSAGQGTFVVALSPDGRRLWATNAVSNDIAPFRVQADGRLVPVGAPTPAGGDGPRGIVVAPDGEACMSHSTPMAMAQERWPRSAWVAPARSKRSGNRSLRAVMVPRPSHLLATDADSS